MPKEKGKGISTEEKKKKPHLIRENISDVIFHDFSSHDSEHTVLLSLMLLPSAEAFS